MMTRSEELLEDAKILLGNVTESLEDDHEIKLDHATESVDLILA